MQGYAWENNGMQIGVAHITPIRKKPVLTIIGKDGALISVASFRSEEQAEQFIKAFEQFIGLTDGSFNETDAKALWEIEEQNL